jgi:hypothetical protein
MQPLPTQGEDIVDVDMVDGIVDGRHVTLLTGIVVDGIVDGKDR